MTKRIQEKVYNFFLPRQLKTFHKSVPIEAEIDRLPHRLEFQIVQSRAEIVMKISFTTKHESNFEPHFVANHQIGYTQTSMQELQLSKRPSCQIHVSPRHQSTVRQHFVHPCRIP